MPKGIIKLSKSSKGKIIVALDRLNGKSPMPLSSVSFNDMTFNEKDCDYGFENGQVTYIKIDNVQVYPSVSAAPVAYPQRGNSPMQQTQGVKQMPDSFDMKKTLLAQNVRSIQIHDIDNFNLKLYKAQRFDSEKDKFYFFKNDKRTSKEGVVSGDSFLIRPNYGDLDFNQINKRLATQANMYNNEKIEFQPDWRMIVGIGGGSVYEVSMTLHHLYGCPYIPASSIKGLVRSWIIQNCFGTEGGDETKPSSEAEAFNKSKLLCDIFGCAEKTDYKIDIVGKKDKVTKSEDSYYKKQKNQANFDEKQGDVIFFDAFPTNAPNIEVDIMNVHYQDYYSDADKESPKVMPTDTQKTNPIPFLTVGNKTRFQSFVAVKDNKKIEDLDSHYALLTKETDLNGETLLLYFVKTWLNKALSEHGIGAKTAVGYGYMK